MDEGKPPPTEEPPAAGGTPNTAAGEASPSDRSAVEPAPDWETQFKYLLADFENYRKRKDREREASRFRERAELLRGLLPIHDAFERAREAVSKAPKNDPIRRGMELLAREWEGFLAREAIEPVAAVGRRFDSDAHEAVAETVAGAGAPEGTIVEIVQQGYRFRGGLLRPAKVVVARARSVSAPAPAPDPARTEPTEPGRGAPGGEGIA